MKLKRVMKEEKLLYCTWGYNMTINSFYKVIKETPKGAIIREIGTTILDGGGMFGNETPNPEIERTEKDWTDNTMKIKEYRVIKTKDGYKGSIGLSSTHYLSETKVGEKHYYNHLD